MAMMLGRRVEVVVGRGDLGGGHAEPSGLDVHHLDQGQIELVVEDGGAGELLEAGAPAMWSMWAWVMTICLTVRWWLARSGDDAGDVVAGIDDDGLAGGFVAEDGAVALERAYGEDFVDH